MKHKLHVISIKAQIYHLSSHQKFYVTGAFLEIWPKLIGLWKEAANSQSDPVYSS